MPRGLFFDYLVGMGVLRFVFVALLLCSSVWAMPALTLSRTISQPDGSSLNVRTVGNEVYHYRLTEDGYAVARNESGFFCYVGEDGSTSGICAHQVAERSDREMEFLKSLDKDGVIRLLDSGMGESRYRHFQKPAGATFGEGSDIPAVRRMPSANPNLNSGEKKALVILVQFADVKFSREDPKAEFEAYLNQEGYDEKGNLGSVRDYFVDNSSGKFIPSFDVVGPITLNYSAYKDFGNYSVYGTMGAAIALSYALDTLIAQGELDFKQYDNDGDRNIDFVHMIYAGVGSNDTYQDSAMWPHQWYLAGAYACLMQSSCSTAPRPNGLSLSGKAVAASGYGINRKYYYVNAYASSNELDGVAWTDNQSSKQKVGVGTFVHEFSHLLGLGDHYATDNTDTYTASYWDVMDGGAYNVSAVGAAIGTAPPYYSGFERMYLGWMTADEIADGDEHQLHAVQNNVALKLTNPKNADEFFVMEYRNREKWDVGLPNHGMLLWHINYSQSVWEKGEINTAAGLHVDLVEADGKANVNTVTADVFPGTGWGKKYTSFNQFVTWDGTDLGYEISNITEASDYSYVAFNVKKASDTEEPTESSSSVQEVSSSSEEVIESSSSLEPESSSSEVLPESSSSEEILESSSSEKVQESSSSEEVEDPKVVRNGFTVPGVNISRVGGVLNVYGLPQGDKVLRVFSVNGNMLLSRLVVGRDFSLDVTRLFGKMSVIVQIVKDKRIIATVPVR